MGFIVLDMLLDALVTPYILRSGRFILNDYEVVRRDHPEKVWDKVFFGNSIVIAAYMEEESESGYVNLGVDYGVVTDLWDMLRRGIVSVGSELVIGLNDLTLYDDFETNPGYPWHRGALEPYCYFERDRLRTLFTETVSQVLTDFEPEYIAVGQTRGYYYGSLSTAEIAEKAATSPYTALPMEDFEENFRALENVADYCESNGIRLRLLWMPLNPAYDVPESTALVRERTRSFAQERGVEFNDMSDALPGECFYDIGHLNREYGAYVFTEAIDVWLLS